MAGDVRTIAGFPAVGEVVLRPELDAVAVGVVDVGRPAPARTTAVDARLETVLGEPLDGGVEVVVREVQGEVDVRAAAAACDAVLRAPQPDPRTAAQDPERLAPGPALEDGQPSCPEQQPLGRFEVVHLEDQLAHPGDGQRRRAGHVDRASRSATSARRSA